MNEIGHGVFPRVVAPSNVGAGGGLFLRESPAAVEATTIHDSTASATGTGPSRGHGGGLPLLDGTATVRNCTVIGNQARHDGGGIVVSGGTIVANLMLVDTTVAGLDAGLTGGGLTSRNDDPGATTSFRNSLVGGNSAPTNESCHNPDLGLGPGILDSLGSNLPDYDLCEFDQPTDLPNTNPLLGPLQVNGGPT